MTKYDREELTKQDAAKWDKYYDADETERTLRNGVPDKKETFFKITSCELASFRPIQDMVLVNIDDLIELNSGGLTLKLPADFGDDQNNTKNKSVSGIVCAGDIQKGCRVFFHYNCLINAKISLPKAGIFIECEGKGYLLLPRKVIYTGIFEGKPVALHTEFCITEPIERTDWIENNGLLGRMNDFGLLVDVESKLKASPYEPFKAKVVSLPANTQENALVRLKNESILTQRIETYSIIEGDTVEVGKAWQIPLENGIQQYLGGKTYFRTRISNIKTKI